MTTLAREGQETGPGTHSPVGTPRGGPRPDSSDEPESRSTVQGRRIVRSGLALSSLLVMVGFALEPSPERLLLGALVLYSFAVVTWPLFTLRDQSLLSPLYFLLLIVFLSNPLRFFVIAAYPELKTTQWYLAQFDLDDFIVGSLMTAVGLTALVVGYSSTQARAAVPSVFLARPADISLRRLRLLGLVATIVSTAVIAITVRSGSTTDSLSAKRGEVVDGVRFANAYVDTLVDSLFAFVAVLALVTLPRRGKLAIPDKLLLFAGVSLSVAFAFISQDRSRTPLILLGLAVIFSIALGRFPWRTAIAALVLGGALFSAMTEIRLSSRPSVAERQQALEHLSPPEDLMVTIGGAFNMGGFVANSHAYEVVPSVMGHAYGLTFVEALARPIPRQIWHDKPVATGQTWVTAFRGDRFGASAGGGGAPGIVAEAYWNFSWLGIVTVLFVLGRLLRLLSNTVHAYGLDRPLLVALSIILSMALPQTIYGRDLASGLVELGTNVFFVGLIGALSRLTPTVKCSTPPHGVAK